MKSKKSTNLIINKKDYDNRNINTLILKPSLDTRNLDKEIHSRLGLECSADYIINENANHKLAIEIFNKAVRLNAVIMIDEVQFVNIKFLSTLIHRIQLYKGKSDNVCLLLYGLLKTYKGKLFPISTFLVETVDDLIEISTICQFKGCKQKATYSFLNTKKDDSSDLFIGDNEYSIYCPKHFYLMNGELNE